MGRASSSKKVARAASTGGGRTTRGAKPIGWYAAIALVVVLGVGGIVFSRAERRQELASGKNLTAPTVKDHWHSAYGLFLCDAFVPPVTDERGPKGIHTHADGIIHIHPKVRSASGDKATLGLFADAVRMRLTDSEIKLPGGKTYKEGDTECGGKPGIVQVKVDDKVVTENIRSIKYTDRQLLTIAFAPKGAELGEPPSKAKLDDLDDVPQQQQQPIQIPPGGVPPGAPGDPAAADPNAVEPAPTDPAAPGSAPPSEGAPPGTSAP